LGKIILGDPVIKENRLSARISATRDVDKYLWKRELLIEYDADISTTESILNIPLTAIALPLAWLTGSDIQVGALDSTFKKSMDQLKNIFHKMYPLAPFSTKILSKNLIENVIEVKDPNRRTALLFSGGVDSTYSLINNLEKKPRLIMHWGVDGYPYPEWSNYWNKSIQVYTKQAHSLGLQINVVKTNVLEILHARRIEHDFHKELYDGSLWLRLHFTLVLASLIAPLSVNRFDKLIVAASHDPYYADIDTWGPTANEPITDERIKWADLDITQDGYILRHKKIKTKIFDYIKNNNLILRVCNSREKSGSLLNCSQCEKCFRTIVPMLQVGLDPNNYGFTVNESTANKIKKMFLESGISTQVLDYQWGPIIEAIPENIEYDIYGSRELLEWIKKHDISSTEKDVWFFRDIYMNLPWSIAKGLNEIYKIFDINISEHSPVRTKKKLDKSQID